MFPLILTVLNRDYTRGYYTANEGLLVEGGTSQVFAFGVLHCPRFSRSAGAESSAHCFDSCLEAGAQYETET